MVKLSHSLLHWLCKNHSDIMNLIMLGHTELVTEDMRNQYLHWCKTDEGKTFLVGKANYIESEE